MERRSHRPAPKARRRAPTSSRGGARGGGRGGATRQRRERTLPPWLTLLGSILFLVVSFAFIFFVARGCVAAQESAEVRTYITNAKSTLNDSANLGSEELQGNVSLALEDPESLDPAAFESAAQKARNGYLDALRNEDVPPEFEEAHHYMVSALGIRAAAVGDLAEATRGDQAGLAEAMTGAVDDFKLSDALVRDHYLPASETALSGRRSDRAYLYEPEPFMDYEPLGLQTDGGDVAAPSNDPNALHGVEIFAVEVAGQPLYPGGNVVLTGESELVFAVTVTNGGEVAETGVPVEVILNTSAERQALSAEVERIEPGESATVEVRGFRPGELDETVEATVTVGPVEYERNEDNNAISGTVTFGL